MINRYENLKDVETVDLDYLEVQDVTESDLKDFHYRLKDLTRNIGKYQPISESPYRYLHLESFEEQQHSETKKLLQDFASQIKELESRVENCYGFSGLKVDFSKVALKDFDILKEIANDINALHNLNCSTKVVCSDPSEIGVAFNAISRYQAICEQHNGTIGKEWHTKALELDIPSLISEWNEIKKGMFKGKQRKAFVSKIDSYSLKGGISEENVEAQLRLLGQIISSHSEDQAVKNAIPAEYLDYLECSNSTMQEIKDLVFKVQASIKCLSILFAEDSTIDMVDLFLPVFFTDNRIETILEVKESIVSLLNNISSILVIDPNVFDMHMEELKTNTEYWANHLNALYEWAYCNGLRKWFENQPYSLSFMERALAGEDVEAINKQLLASYYKVQIERTVRQNSSLNRYDRESFEELVSDLTALEKEYRDQVVSSIPGRLDDIIAARSKNYYSRQEIDRFILSNGKRRSIRSLFSTCSEYITDICPCLLMSPMSVSQFLEPGKQVFDIVVFDEASQIQTCKAIGAIARGKDLVVVGDSKQMPPTNFFKKAVSDDDEEYSVEAERMQDLESILDDCDTLGLPSTRLSWHYRSNNESLIHFSNKRYYNHKLKTYPSIDSMESKVRLKLCKGYYQPGNKEPNPFEAEAIVESIKKRLKDSVLCKDSIGVITFNEKQQNLIISKLDDLFERNRNLAKLAHWDESELDCPDKLIVKNLENIQGDERDVIMLSVTFGKSKSGRFVKNFGPIGKLGGEKRLNVAFSRARKLMEIYTIIDVDEFSSEILSSRGANDLREFLKYASHRDKIDSSGSSEETVRKEIAKAIEREGYQTSFDVGLSDFKIDIAVKNPKDNNVYFCGIMLDGTSMTTAHLANDRFVLRRAILRNRGWRLIQVRSIDWWKDPECELSAIIKRIGEYAADVEAQELSSNEPEVAVNDIEEVETSFAGTYKACELDYLPIDSTKITKQPLQIFEARFREVISFEGPIIDDLLELRVLNSFGVKKRGKNIKPFLDDILDKMDLVKTVQIDPSNERHIVFWPEKYREYGEQVEDNYKQFRCSSDSDDEEKKRAIQDYPQVEIRNVMVSLIREKGSYLKDSLLEDTARKMGFKRIGSGILDTMNIVYNDALLSGKIILNQADGTLISEE